MTFLKGQTTWALLRDKLNTLITGEGADDFGVTTAVGSRWRRQTPGSTCLLPPAGNDLTYTQEHRAGYWSRQDDVGLFSDRVSGAGAYIRQTGILTSYPVTLRTAYHVMIKVTVANNVAGDYSTVQLHVKGQAVDDTTFTASTGLFSTPNAAGLATITAITGVTFAIQVADPTGFLPLGAVFVRTFTSDFRGGFDVWRGFAKATAAPTFTTAPPGVAVTDYSATVLGSSNNFTTTATFLWSPGVETFAPVAKMHGLGIKTSAGLTGDRYVVSFPFNIMHFSLNYTSTLASTSSTLDCVVGAQAPSPSTGVLRNTVEGYNSQFNSRPSQGLGFLSPFLSNPTSTAAKVEYWISVTPTHIAISLNGESAFTGQTTQNQVVKITQARAGRQPSWYAGVIVDSNTSTVAFAGARDYVLIGRHPQILGYMVKGFRDGGRDFQTGDGRNDFLGAFAGVSVARQASGWSGEWYTSPVSQKPWEGISLQVTTGASPVLISPVSARGGTINYADPTWPMTGVILMAHNVSASTAPAAEAQLPGYAQVEGYIDEGFLVSGAGGYGDGDELTDLNTGTKYMLFTGTNRSAPAGTGWALALEEV